MADFVQVFSAPMAQILDRLQAFGEFEVINLALLINEMNLIILEVSWLGMQWNEAVRERLDMGLAWLVN